MSAPVCVVTGAAGDGIGRGICEVVASSGFVVVVTDVDYRGARSLANELEQRGYNSEARELDVTNPEMVASLFPEVAERWGRLDGLVNSAGIGLVKPGAEVTLDEWTSLLDIDLRGAWLCAKAAIPIMIAAGGGSIVNIGSVQALGPHVGYAIYSAAKSGLVGLTKGIAADYGPDNIRCNVVHPGLVDGAQTRRLLLGMGRDADAWIDRYLHTKQMLPTAITPDDVGRLVRFLLGSESRSITATEFVIDAGSSAMAFDREESESR